MAMSIEETLAQRQKTHGDFSSHAAVSQAMKKAMRQSAGWGGLSDDKKEALEMLAHKIARILNGNPDTHDHWHDIEEKAYINCAARELREETGLDVAAAALKLFCRLCFKTPEGDAAECCFFAARGDVDAARTVEAERVFVGEVAEVIAGGVSYHYWSDRAMSDECGIIPTMPNLPYIVAMARQCLRGGDTTKTWPLTVYENGATP